MATATTGTPMARRRKDAADEAPAHEAPAQMNVKVDKSLHRKLKVLATTADCELGDYVDRVLREHVEREWPRFLRDQA